MTPLALASVLRPLPLLAEEFGLDWRRLLLDARLDWGMLEQPGVSVPAARVAAVLEMAALRAGVDSFGLRMAAQRRLSDLGPVGLLIRDQPTLRQALQTLQDSYHRASTTTWVQLDEGSDPVQMRLAVRTGDSAPARQANEMALGSLLMVLRGYLGPQWQPRFALFEHAAPRDLSWHLRLFGPDLRFEQPCQALGFDARELDAENPLADPAMTRYAEQLLDDAAALLPAVPVDAVRRLVACQLPRGRCSVDQIASHLGLRGRTLQRQLAAQGVGFLALVNAERLKLAHQHLAQLQRPLREVAGLVGFGSPGAFSRWYQFQTGRAPTACRAALKAALTNTP